MAQKQNTKRSGFHVVASVEGRETESVQDAKKRPDPAKQTLYIDASQILSLFAFVAVIFFAYIFTGQKVTAAELACSRHNDFARHASVGCTALVAIEPAFSAQRLPSTFPCAQQLRRGKLCNEPLRGLCVNFGKRSIYKTAPKQTSAESIYRT